jgi:hypothetical protein
VAPLADGEWSWRRDEVGDDRVQRIEAESWHLTTRGREISGYYDRRVTLRSVDDVPFRCNQATEYELFARYTIEGTQNGNEIELREVAHDAVPSPCESGHRALAVYRGTLSAHRLELAWPSGAQTLTRAGDAQPPAPLPRYTTTVAGTWTWKTKTEQRAETERWRLEERDTGVVVGSYERTVTEGDCQLVERYELRGTRSGAHLTVAEVEVQVEPAECESNHGERHLDSARGTAYGQAIVLVWRGGRRQVLSRL